MLLFYCHYQAILSLQIYAKSIAFVFLLLNLGQLMGAENEVDLIALEVYFCFMFMLFSWDHSQR